MSCCPPQPPPPCPQICPPPPPPPVCRSKPVMRGLHWKQTMRHVFTALFLSSCAGACVYYFIGVTRKERYKDFYAKAEFEDWAEEMAKKGLFQAVPKRGRKEDTNK